MKITVIFSIILLLFSCGKVDETKTQESTENREEKEKIILALGDSLTAGYNLDIKESYPLQLEKLLKVNNYNYKVQNAGVSGDTSKNLLDRITLYDEIDVDVYLVGIGSNDGLRRQSIDTMTSNINNIIDHIQNINPEAEIVLEGMQMPLNVGLEYSKDFKDTFASIALEKGVNFYEFLLEDVATKTELNLSDGIHPNKKGYAIIAGNIYNFLEEENLIKK